MTPSFDPDQRAVLDAPRTHALLVTGDAGTGKTTVAVARAGRLTGRDERALVLVPTEALADRVRADARRVAGNVAVEAVLPWLRQRAERAVGGRLSPGEEVPARVDVAKRHPVMGEVAEMVASQELHRGWLHELWGDRWLMDEARMLAGGDLSADDLEAVQAYAEVQHAELPRDGRGEVVRGMDGPVHRGTPLHDAETVDRGDLGVLLHQAQLAGRRLQRWHHVVVDEVQELSPLELGAAVAAACPDGSLTLVGDAGQQLDPGAWFRGWAELPWTAARPLVRKVLRHAHRCPADVLAVAEAVRDGRSVPRRGRWSRWADEAARRASLADLPRGAVVVASDGARARRLARQLGRAVVTPDELRGREVPWVVLPELSEAGWPDTARSRRALYVAMTRATGGLWCGAVGGFGSVVGG